MAPIIEGSLGTSYIDIVLTPTQPRTLCKIPRAFRLSFIGTNKNHSIQYPKQLHTPVSRYIRQIKDNIQ